ncbi:MAG: MFS transporter [Planctomycetes bacterium]|nr:MFS transporter [Planctomycetota bacterium]
MPPRRPYHALQHRDFRMLWGTNMLSITGSQMQTVAINLHVYLLTGSALALGMVGLSRVIPIVIFSLWGGVAADRFNRRWVMFCTQMVMTLVAVALAGLTWSRHDAVWGLFVLNALSAAATSFDNPARQALVPRLVPREDLPGTLALNLTAFHAATIGGPALAGLIISGSGFSFTHDVAAMAQNLAHSTRGLALIYAINAVSFLGVLASLVLMKTSGRVETVNGAAHPRLLESLFAGLRFVFKTPIMVWTMALDFLATFFYGATSLLPIVADRLLHVGPVGYGWLVAATGIGALIGSFYTSVFPMPRRQGRLFLWSIAACGVLTVVFGLSRHYWLTFAALAGIGLADLVSTVIRQTLRQLVTPDALRGRMTSVNMIFFMGGPQLGEFEAGLIAAAFSVTASIVSGGIATVVVVALIAAITPVVRKYDVAEWSADK